jgi:hypothetical protein
VNVCRRGGCCQPASVEPTRYEGDDDFCDEHRREVETTRRLALLASGYVIYESVRASAEPPLCGCGCGLPVRSQFNGVWSHWRNGHNTKNFRRTASA